MESPPHIPLLPYFVGLEGYSIQAAKNLDAVSAVKKLSYQIASDLQNASSIPKKQTLAKFSTVVRVLRTMSYDQIRKVAYETYSAGKNQEANAW